MKLLIFLFCVLTAFGIAVSEYLDTLRFMFRDYYLDTNIIGLILLFIVIIIAVIFTYKLIFGISYITSYLKFDRKKDEVHDIYATIDVLVAKMISDDEYRNNYSDFSLAISNINVQDTKRQAVCRYLRYAVSNNNIEDRIAAIRLLTEYDISPILRRWCFSEMMNICIINQRYNEAFNYGVKAYESGLHSNILFKNLVELSCKNDSLIKCKKYLEMVDMQQILEDLDFSEYVGDYFFGKSKIVEDFKEKLSILKHALRYFPYNEKLILYFYEISDNGDLRYIEDVMAKRPSFNMFLVYKKFSNLSNNDLFLRIKTYTGDKYLLIAIAEYLGLTDKIDEIISDICTIKQ